MPRKSRKAQLAPYYHIMVQGLNKEYIFNNTYYKEIYYKFLMKYTKELNIDIISYCIMDNHAHILLKVKDIKDMYKCMHKLNTLFALIYNKEKKRVGYVFRDRYRAEPIFEFYYLYNCIKYIHNNPVKAYICKKPEDYIFSSYSQYKKMEWFQNDDLFHELFPNEEVYQGILNPKMDEDIYFDEEKYSLEEARKWLHNFLNNTYCDLSTSQEVIELKIIKELKYYCKLEWKEISEITGLSIYKINKLIEKEKHSLKK